MELVHEFTWRVVSKTPVLVGAGPFGKRLYYELPDATITGKRLNGKMVGKGGDWMLVGPDGYVQIDVRGLLGMEHLVYRLA